MNIAIIMTPSKSSAMEYTPWNDQGLNGVKQTPSDRQHHDLCPGAAQKTIKLNNSVTLILKSTQL